MATPVENVRPVHRSSEYSELREHLRTGYVCKLHDPLLPMPREVSLVCKKRNITLTFTDSQMIARSQKLKELLAPVTCRGGSPETRYGILLDELEGTRAIRIYVDTQDSQRRIIELLTALRDIKPRSVGKKFKSLLVRRFKEKPIMRRMTEVVEEFVDCDDLQAYVFNMINVMVEADEGEDLEQLLREAESYAPSGMKRDLRLSRTCVLGLMEYFYNFNAMPLKDDSTIWDDEITFTTFYESFQALAFPDLVKFFNEARGKPAVLEQEDRDMFMNSEQFNKFLTKSQGEPASLVNSIMADEELRRMPFMNKESGISIFGFANCLASPANTLFDSKSTKQTNQMNEALDKYWISTCYMHYRSLEAFQEVIPECRCFCFNVRRVDTTLMVQFVDTEYYLSEILSNLKGRAFSRSPYPVLCLFFSPDAAALELDVKSTCEHILDGKSVWQGDISSPEAAKEYFILGMFDNVRDPSLWTDEVAVNPFCLNEPRIPKPITWEQNVFPEVPAPVASVSLQAMRRASVKTRVSQNATGEGVIDSAAAESDGVNEPLSNAAGHGEATSGSEALQKQKKGLLGGIFGKDRKWGGKKTKATRQAEKDWSEAEDAQAIASSGLEDSDYLSPDANSPTSAERVANRPIQLVDTSVVVSKIHVALHSAERLPKAGSYQTRDTSVLITLANERPNGTFADIEASGKYKSSVVRKNVNPQYDFSCTIDVPRDCQRNTDGVYVRFIVVQDNRLMGKSNIGEAVCAMNVILDRSGEKLSFPVFPIDKDKKAAAKAQDCPILIATITKETKSSGGSHAVEGCHQAVPLNDNPELAPQRWGSAGWQPPTHAPANKQTSSRVSQRALSKEQTSSFVSQRALGNERTSSLVSQRALGNEQTSSRVSQRALGNERTSSLVSQRALGNERTSSHVSQRALGSVSNPVRNPAKRQFEGVHAAPASSSSPSSSSSSSSLVKVHKRRSKYRVAESCTLLLDDDVEHVSSISRMFEGCHRASPSGFFALNGQVALQGITTPYSVKDWNVDAEHKLVLSYPICMRNAPRSVQHPASHWGHGVSLVSYSPGVSPETDALHRGWFRDNGSIGYVRKPAVQELRLQKPQTVRFEFLGGRLLQGRVSIKVELRAETVSAMQTEYARPKFGCSRWLTPIEMVANKPQLTLVSLSVLCQGANVLKPEVLGSFCAPLRICRQGIRWIELGNWSGILLRLTLS